MKSIKDLLEKRDELFVDQTNVAMERAAPILDGIQEYLISVDPSYGPGRFSWEEMAVWEEILMMVGVIYYDPGTELLLDGEMITVTEDNKDYFSRVLRIGIPVSVADKNEKEAVIEFLTNLNSVVEEDEIKKIIVQEVAPDVLETEKQDSADFDLDELTDEQREALMHHDLGKIN